MAFHMNKFLAFTCAFLTRPHYERVGGRSFEIFARFADVPLRIYVFSPDLRIVLIFLAGSQSVVYEVSEHRSKHPLL